MSLSELRAKALSKGASDFGVSRAKGKKYYVIYNGKRLNFGAKGYEHFTGGHKDEKRRKAYLARHKAIKTKDGKPAYLNKNKSSYWALNILWM